jgi:hypothetical protein
MRIYPIGAELFHADGQTDMSKLTEAFRNFAKAPKNNLFISVRTPPPKKLIIFKSGLRSSVTELHLFFFNFPSLVNNLNLQCRALHQKETSHWQKV